jgi:hypothetical protein
MAPMPLLPSSLASRRPAMTLSPSQLGNRNLILAMLAYQQAGYIPFDPIGDGTKADFIAEPSPALAARGVRLERVQIKAARYRGTGAIDANVRVPSRGPTSGPGTTSSDRYSRDDIDAFVLVTHDARVFRVPVSSFVGELPTGISLRLEPPKNNQVAGVRLARDFEMPVHIGGAILP